MRVHVRAGGPALSLVLSLALSLAAGGGALAQDGSGTAFDFTVTPEGTQLLLLSKDSPEAGAVVCPEGGECEEVTDVCDLATAEEGKDAEVVKGDKLRAQQLRSQFPILASQARLEEDFQVRPPEDEEDDDDDACFALLAAGTASTAIAGSTIPAAAIVGGLVIVGGVVIGVVAGGGGDGGGTTSTTGTR